MSSIDGEVSFGSSITTMLGVKALIRHMHFYGWSKGTGNFSLYIDGAKAAFTEFSDTTRPITKEDWSGLIQEKARGNQTNIQLKIENYIYNADGQGFEFPMLL